MNSSSCAASLSPASVLDRDDQRRVADDPALAVDHLGELAERPQAVLGPRLRDVLLEPLALLARGLPGEALDQVVDVEARVPEVHRPHPGEGAHRLAVGAGGGEIDLAPGLPVEAPVAARDLEAGDEPLEVPLERAGKGLVEVVDAEDQAAVRRREHAEVRQVRVAAELDVEPGARPGGEVRRHQVRGAAVEGERRHQHPPVADRHELGNAGAALRLEQLDGIGPVVGRLPLAVHAAADLRPRRLAGCGALVHREVLYLARGGSPGTGAIAAVGGGLVGLAPSLGHRGAHRLIPAGRGGDRVTWIG